MLYAPIPLFGHQQRIDALRSLSLRSGDPILAERLRRLADGLEKRVASPAGVSGAQGGVEHESIEARGQRWNSAAQ